MGVGSYIWLPNWVMGVEIPHYNTALVDEIRLMLVEEPLVLDDKVECKV